MPRARRDVPARRAGKRVAQRGGRRGNAFTRRGRSDPDSGVGFGGAKNRMRFSQKIARVLRAKCRARVEGNRVRRASWILVLRNSLIHAGRYDRGNRRSSAIKREFRSHPRMRFSGGSVPFFPLFPSHHGFGLVRAETRETIERGRRRGGPTRSRAWNDATSGVSRHDRARRRRARTLSLFPPPPFGRNLPGGSAKQNSPRRIESNRIESNSNRIEFKSHRNRIEIESNLS